MEWITELLTRLVPAVLGVVLSFAVGKIGRALTLWLEEGRKAGVLSEVARICMQAVEQTLQGADGQTKLKSAVSMAKKFLEERNISVEESELCAMIESAVCEWNRARGDKGYAALD